MNSQNPCVKRIATSSHTCITTQTKVDTQEINKTPFLLTLTTTKWPHIPTWFFTITKTNFVDNQYVNHISLTNTFQFQAINISSKTWLPPSKLLENALQIVGLHHDLHINSNMLMELCETYLFPMFKWKAIILYSFFNRQEFCKLLVHFVSNLKNHWLHSKEFLKIS
jgi:hypothetical protein